MESAERSRTSNDPREEAGLIAAAQRGDTGAFGMLVRIHQRTIYRLAYGLTRNASDADDLAQETFVRAFRAIGRFRVGEPMQPWLSRITVNLAFSMFRRRKRRPEVALEPLVEAGRQFAGGGEDPADVTARREKHRMVTAAFEELSNEHRVVLALRVVQDMSYDDIARTLRVPVGTVMSRLSRARAELRARLDARIGKS
ncbi:MAG: RNA polymerase sigma factor [Candidatus Eiseniibacteriota bacterium]